MRALKIFVNFTPYLAVPAEQGVNKKFATELPPPAEFVSYKTPLSGTINFVKEKNLIISNFNCRTTIILTCDRCLEEFDLKIEPQFNRIYSLNMPVETNQKEEIFTLPKNLTIDILPIINEEIVLNLPLNKLCAKDCRGLCQACGANLNHHKKHQCQTAK